MHNFVKFLYKSHQNVVKHHGFLFAKSLAFQTLFCFIPGIVTILFLAGYVNLLDKPIAEFKNILSEQFIPHVIQSSLFSQLDIAVQHASSASLFAISIFLVSTFSLITSIQEIYYQFGEYKEPPPIKHQFLIYLFFMLGVLGLLILSCIITFLVSKTGTLFDFPTFLLKLFNLIFLSFMIFSLYTVISPVKFKTWITLFVSFLVSIILLIAQKLFVLYVLWFPGYMLVYGAIAFLPLLFFWLYIYWIIFLYGYSILIQSNLNQF